MTNFDTEKYDEQADVLDMVSALIATDVFSPADDAHAVAAARARLAELGIWTAAVREAWGGGGADWSLAMSVFAALGGRWAALAWASVQAHVAAELLSEADAEPELLSQVHAGNETVAVIARGAVRLDAGPGPTHLLVLDVSSASLHAPASYVARSVDRTGFSGAGTALLAGDPGPGTPLGAVNTDRARTRLYSGAAAIATGIAEAAAAQARNYVAERHQFGRPLVSFTAVREESFNVAARAKLLRMQLEASETTKPWEAAALLANASRVAVDVTAQALQLHGGYGYLTEYPVGSLLRDAVSLGAATDAAGAEEAAAAQLEQARNR